VMKTVWAGAPTREFPRSPVSATPPVSSG